MVETFMIVHTSVGAPDHHQHDPGNAENISESSAECTAAALDDEFAAEMFVKELARDDLDAGTRHRGHVLSRRHAGAMEGCLTATEMNSIDFN